MGNTIIFAAPLWKVLNSFSFSPNLLETIITLNASFKSTLNAETIHIKSMVGQWQLPTKMMSRRTTFHKMGSPSYSWWASNYNPLSDVHTITFQVHLTNNMIHFVGSRAPHRRPPPQPYLNAISAPYSAQLPLPQNVLDTSTAIKKNDFASHTTARRPSSPPTITTLYLAQFVTYTLQLVHICCPWPPTAYFLNNAFTPFAVVAFQSWNSLSTYPPTF